MEFKNGVQITANMKKTLFLGLTFLACLSSFSQTLFTYGPFSVSKDEFWRAYNKNKTPVANKEQSLREYLDLTPTRALTDQRATAS